MVADRTRERLDGRLDAGWMDGEVRMDGWLPANGRLAVAFWDWHRASRGWLSHRRSTPLRQRPSMNSCGADLETYPQSRNHHTYLSPLTASTADHASTVPSKSPQLMFASMGLWGPAPSSGTHQEGPPIMRVTGGRRTDGGWMDGLLTDGGRPDGWLDGWREVSGGRAS